MLYGNHKEKYKKNYGMAKAKYTDNKKKYDDLAASKQPEIEKIKRKLAKEIIDNYLNNMKKIGIDYDSAVKYLQEGGKDGIS